jgi:Universal stress protein family
MAPVTREIGNGHRSGLDVSPNSLAAAELASAIARRLGDELLMGRNAAEVISAAAERLAVEVISLGSHERPGPSKAVIGSVAHEVMARSARPVLVVRPPRDEGGRPQATIAGEAILGILATRLFSPYRG